jgi:predicted HTH transcriptional regulator
MNYKSVKEQRNEEIKKIQLEIVAYAVKHEEMSLRQIAEVFGCERKDVAYAIRLYGKGYKRSKGSKPGTRHVPPVEVR